MNAEKFSVCSAFLYNRSFKNIYYCQFIISTHSPFLLAMNDAKVLFDMITFMAEGYMTHNIEQVLKNPEKTISLFNRYMDSLKENYYSH